MPTSPPAATPTPRPTVPTRSLSTCFKPQTVAYVSKPQIAANASAAHIVTAISKAQLATDVSKIQVATFVINSTVLKLTPAVIGVFLCALQDSVMRLADTSRKEGEQTAGKSHDAQGSATSAEGKAGTSGKKREQTVVLLANEAVIGTHPAKGL